MFWHTDDANSKEYEYPEKESNEPKQRRVNVASDHDSGPILPRIARAEENFRAIKREVDGRAKEPGTQEKGCVGIGYLNKKEQGGQASDYQQRYHLWPANPASQSRGDSGRRVGRIARLPLSRRD